MTTQEKNLMMNPEHKPFMDLPPVIQHLMQENREHLVWLTTDGNWTIAGTVLYRGSVYTVCATAAVTPPQVQHKRYPVFCGSDRIYKVNLTKPGMDDARIYHLHTITGMADFAGIRYRDSQEWKPTLDTVTHGVPSEVRFAIR